MFSRRWIKFKQRIKNLGRPKCYTFGVANFCENNRWHVFFDVDMAIEAPYEHKGVLFIKTLHGFQVLDMECKSLQDVYEVFKLLKRQFKTDYFWSVPLWLRIGPKWLEDGREVSPMPEYPDMGRYLWVMKHFRVKKLYSTWL